VAAVTIAASLAVILTVGGLVLLKGPPAAQARTEAPSPALVPAPHAAAPVPTPPKPDLIVHVPRRDDSGEVRAPDGDDQPPAPEDY
jgi:hypothetical protein